MAAQRPTKPRRMIKMTGRWHMKIHHNHIALNFSKQWHFSRVCLLFFICALRQKNQIVCIVGLLWLLSIAFFDILFILFFWLNKSRNFLFIIYKATSQMASHLGTVFLYLCLLQKHFHKPFAWNVTTKVELRKKQWKNEPEAFVCVICIYLRRMVLYFTLICLVSCRVVQLPDKINCMEFRQKDIQCSKFKWWNQSIPKIKIR